MNRPKVALYGCASVDGRPTIAPDVLLMFGDKRWDSIAGSDGEIASWLRTEYKPQAYLEGSGSLVKMGEKPKPLPSFSGDPKLLYKDFLPESVVKRPSHKGWFIMVNSKGMIRWTYKEWASEEWAGWHLMVIVAKQTPAKYLTYLQKEEIPYLVAGEDRANLRSALEKIKSQLGVTSVVSTSPGKLGGALLREWLVDEINILYVPAIVGGFDTPSLFKSPELKPSEWPTRLKFIFVHVLSDGRIWLRYKVIPRETRKAIRTE